MPSVEKRLEAIMDDLSPEQKCALLLEDELLPEPSLSDAERLKLLTMDQEDGRRYYEYLDRFEKLRADVSKLVDLTQKMLVLLLSRDRILWYIGGVARCQEALTSDPNFTPDSPLKVRVPFATVTLGSPEQGSGVEFAEGVTEILDTYSLRIREMAVEVKSLHLYVKREAREMGLAFVEELADSTVEQVRDWDQPSLSAIMKETQERLKRWDQQGLSEEEMVDRILEGKPQERGMGVFPVDPKWELDWDSLNS